MLSALWFIICCLLPNPGTTSAMPVAAPSIKSSYSELNGWGEIKDYLERSKLPTGTLIHDAPAEDPSRPLSRTEYIAWLRNKGVEVIENSDGSMTNAQTAPAGTARRTIADVVIARSASRDEAISLHAGASK